MMALFTAFLWVTVEILVGAVALIGGLFLKRKAGSAGIALAAAGVFLVLEALLGGTGQLLLSGGAMLGLDYSLTMSPSRVLSVIAIPFRFFAILALFSSVILGRSARSA